MFADVRRAVREPHEKPFAIVMWAYDTHEAYRDGEGPASWPAQYDPPAIRGGRVEAAEFHKYLKAIWRLDRFVGRLYDDLEARGLAEDTLIVVTGDHGESFGDHGLLSHSTGLYEDQVHVPLILINPRLGPLGSRAGRWVGTSTSGPRSPISAPAAAPPLARAEPGERAGRRSPRLLLRRPSGELRRS